MLKFSARNALMLLLGFALLAFAVFSMKRPAEIPALANPSLASVAEKAQINTMYSPGAAPDRRAFNAAEEAYSVNLWKIHDKVKTSAVQLSFAGLSYKLKEIDRAGVQAKIAPQLDIFRAAQSDLKQLTVPESLKELHGTYTTAVNFYVDAAQNMLKMVGDGNEQHLLDAHSKTNQAATLLLKVGSELWPGEFKPN
jgi:hypothetical protein